MVTEKKKVVLLKELVIQFTSATSEPKFIFNGDWAGRDVRIVLRHITQAYRRNQIARAKAMAPAQEPQEPVTVGATNE